MTGRQILVADDEEKMRRVLEIALAQKGHRVLGARDGREALALIEANSVDLVIADLRMPGMGGLDLLAALREQGGTHPFIVVTAHGSIETAVAAMKHGAVDYLLRPFDMDVLMLTVDRALANAAIVRENTFLREEIDRGRDGFVGTSAAMREVYRMIERAGPSRASVLITGETGTGKELAARALHNASPRRDRLFVPINCAAIPPDMLEGELFGHERGAFTGAVRERIGKFELADGGTLFLDEITEMPMELQAKLLRVLQENVIERLGSNRAIPLDIRVIAASNRSPEAAVAEGRLREDLFYRINVISLRLPPLRERPEDIPPLVQHFLEKFGARATGPALPSDALARLESYAWPGNVRELQNLVERASILRSGDAVDLVPFLPATEPLRPAPAPVEPTTARASGPASLEHALAALESRLIADALERSGGNKARAAALLDISERTLWYKLKKHAGSSAP